MKHWLHPELNTIYRYGKSVSFDSVEECIFIIKELQDLRKRWINVSILTPVSVVFADNYFPLLQPGSHVISGCVTRSLTVKWWTEFLFCFTEKASIQNKCRRIQSLAKWDSMFTFYYVYFYIIRANVNVIYSDKIGMRRTIKNAYQIIFFWKIFFLCCTKSVGWKHAAHKAIPLRPHTCVHFLRMPITETSWIWINIFTAQTDYIFLMFTYIYVRFWVKPYSLLYSCLLLNTLLPHSIPLNLSFHYRRLRVFVFIKFQLIMGTHKTKRN